MPDFQDLTDKPNLGALDVWTEAELGKPTTQVVTRMATRLRMDIPEADYVRVLVQDETGATVADVQIPAALGVLDQATSKVTYALNEFLPSMQGQYAAYVSLMDEAGNEGPAAGPVAVSLDFVPPPEPTGVEFI